MQTLAQKWAQKRNATIFRIRGIIFWLNNIRGNSILTDEEEDKIREARLLLEQVAFHWKKGNRRSKANYLLTKAIEGIKE